VTIDGNTREPTEYMLSWTPDGEFSDPKGMLALSLNKNYLHRENSP